MPTKYDIYDKLILKPLQCECVVTELKLTSRNTADHFYLAEYWYEGSIQTAWVSEDELTK